MEEEYIRVWSYDKSLAETVLDSGAVFCFKLDAKYMVSKQKNGDFWIGTYNKWACDPFTVLVEILVNGVWQTVYLSKPGSRIPFKELRKKHFQGKSE